MKNTGLIKADRKRREKLPNMSGTTDPNDCWGCYNFELVRNSEWQCRDSTCPVHCLAKENYSVPNRFEFLSLKMEALRELSMIVRAEFYAILHLCRQEII